MRKNEIFAGRAYTNASMRTERYVLEIGDHVKVRWYGAPDKEPIGEPGVRFFQTRHGKTLYGDTRPMVFYLSTFANWAQTIVQAGKEAPFQGSPGNEGK